MIISSKGLPAPRLELRWLEHQSEELPRHNWICEYTLVVPITVRGDARKSHLECNVEEETYSYKLRWTTAHEPNGPVYPADGDREETIVLPYGDKQHATWDAEYLKLPVYVTCGEKAELLSAFRQVVFSKDIVVRGDTISHKAKTLVENKELSDVGVLKMKEGDKRILEHRSEVKNVEFNKIAATVDSLVSDDKYFGQQEAASHCGKKFIIRKIFAIDVQKD